MSDSTDKYFTVVRGLKLHYVEWGDPKNPPLLLLHGWMDIARSWDQVAPALAEHFHVLALDFRGHGLSDYPGAGGYYHFPNYVYDVSRMVEDVLGGGPIHLVGHSMGGMVSSLYAGTFPEKVARYVNMEGFGPQKMEPAAAPARFGEWIRGLSRQLKKEPRPYETLEEAADKLCKSNPRLSREFGLHLAKHGTARGEDGKYRWRFDPLHKTRNPQPFYVEQAKEFWKRIDCPTLIVVGADSRFQQIIPDWRERVEAYRHGRVVEIPDCGHMIHHERPKELLAEIVPFLTGKSD